MRHPHGLPADLALLDRTLVMGILNVTPDSFSDGGHWARPEEAIARGTYLAAQGADIVDVGGESTRPGAERIPVDEELRRVLPVVAALAGAGVRVSIDTTRAEVARASVEAGACIVNDVSGGLADPDMADAVSRIRVPYVVMHWRGPSTVMDSLADYGDVVADVCAELAARVDALVAAGVDRERLVVDPGLGFAKNSPHNWVLLGRLHELDDLGLPILVGASRKRFLGDLLAVDGVPRSMDGRDAAGDAVTALAAAAGAWCVRVHEVRASRDAVDVVRAWRGTHEPDRS